eukprot:5643628-Pyramimonas_sp.AAC.1
MASWAACARRSVRVIAPVMPASCSSSVLVSTIVSRIAVMSASMKPRAASDAPACCSDVGSCWRRLSLAFSVRGTSWIDRVRVHGLVLSLIHI